MNDPEVIILGYAEAGAWLAANKPDAIISIHGQRGHAVEAPVGVRHLIVQCDDIEAADDSDPLRAALARMRARQAAAEGLMVVPPSEEHAAAIIQFAREMQATAGTLLCHCGAGISRSPAAALLCQATWAGPGHESDCVDQLLRIRPSAQPHRDLVRFGDAALNRNGRLLAALDARFER